MFIQSEFKFLIFQCEFHRRNINDTRSSLRHSCLLQRVLPAINNHNTSRTMQQLCTYIQHTIIQSAYKQHAHMQPSYSQHTHSQHVIRIYSQHTTKQQHAPCRRSRFTLRMQAVSIGKPSSRSVAHALCHSLATLTLTFCHSAHLVFARL